MLDIKQLLWLLLIIVFTDETGNSHIFIFGVQQIISELSYLYTNANMSKHK